MRNHLFLFFIVLSFYSCSNSKVWRNPANINEKKDLQTIIEELNDAVKEEITTSEQCSEGLSHYYKTLFKMTSEDVNWDQLEDNYIDNLINKSFETRLVIKEKLKMLTLNSEMDHKCLASVKNSFRALRYVEDYLIEIKEFKVTDQNKKYVNLTGEAPSFLVNSEFKMRDYKDLKSGDVILSRGNAYSSAAIARIGNNDMQFSHLSFVYIDEEGKAWTSEAHIEIGSVVAPIQTHIDQGNSRSVVFRYKDSAMAHEAAKAMFLKVQKHMKKKNIEYDFAMDYHDDERLFCSEIIYAGFQMASNGEIDIPLYKTKFNKGLVSFLQILGISITEDNFETFETFAPGDIQFDPNFEMVAEWRNPSKIRDSRLKDMILTKMFDWMENLNYQLDPKFGTSVKSRASWLLRRTPLVGRLLRNKFPKNMSTAQLRLFIVLDNVGEVLKTELLKKQKEMKRPMSPIEMFTILDQFREKDYKTWKNKMRFRRNKAIFHKLFHP
ncbi:MAG: hypothetical protein HN576_10265 [Bacteriovoracaceae bacterium]|jgi:hypothetical protein|nr:hypothetical protein [Bacteriovoracaceae bacterium]